MTKMPGQSAKVIIGSIALINKNITDIFYQPIICISDCMVFFLLWGGAENFDMRKNQLTRQGFMELNLMEATEKDGDPADLWVTLEAMGYNRTLELVEVRLHD